MSLGKKDIVKNITSKALLSPKLSQLFLVEFLSLIKKNTTNNIKLANFGVFYIQDSPERIGRNPKTKENFKIPRRKKLSFKASNKVKNKLNQNWVGSSYLKRRGFTLNGLVYWSSLDHKFLYMQSTGYQMYNLQTNKLINNLRLSPNTNTRTHKT